MTEDLQHLKYLSIFHYVEAALSMFFNLFPLLWLAMGIGMASGRIESDPPSPGDAWFGWLFLLFSAGWLLVGLAFTVCLALAGRYLRRRRHYLFCLVTAAVETMFFPLGTALGIFTILVLMRESVKALFGVSTVTTDHVGGGAASRAPIG